MRIAVYSGSFNPLHIGHLTVMRSLTSEGAFDRVYLVVSPRSPFKDQSLSISARSRYDAAVRAVSRYSDLKVDVSDIEFDMPQPSFTIDTLDRLAALERNNSFTFVLGADNLEDFMKWKKAERILTEYGLAVYPREGYDIESLIDKIKKEHRDIADEMKISVIDAPLINISSTQIREALSKGLDVSSFLM